MVNIQRYMECKDTLQKRIDVNHEPSDELLMHLLDVQEVHIEVIKKLKETITKWFSIGLISGLLISMGLVAMVMLL